MTVATETCENCGRLIGAMEQPFVYHERTVCVECYGRLQTPPPQPAPVRHDDLAAAAAAANANVYRPISYATPIHYAPRPKYVDNLFWVRLIVLIAGIFFWPLLLVWLGLGVYHWIAKAQSR